MYSKDLKMNIQSKYRSEPSGLLTMTSSIEHADKYNKWILSKFVPFIGTNLLEVGTGQSNFKNYAKPYVQHYVSIDIDPEVIRRAKDLDPNGTYFLCDISDIKTIGELFQYRFDSIMIINVLEHITNDQSAINNMIELVAVNGHIFIFVPAFQFLYNDLDTLAGHQKRYTKKKILSLIPSERVDVVKLEYFNPVGAIGWYINKIAKHKDLDSKLMNRQMIFFDRYVLPFSWIFNYATKRIFGQSLIMVLKRKF